MQKRDEKLLNDLARGDSSAFEKVFKLHYVPLCNYAIKFVRLPEIAEEVVQEVFIYLWEKRRTIQINGSINAYLFRAVRNRSINYLKLQLPKDNNKEALSPVMEVVDPVHDEDNLKELKFKIDKAIDNLPRQCKIIFNLSRNAGLTYAEIAEEMGISIKTVENQISIALKKLKIALSE